MTLRSDIEAAIDAASDKQEAAINVCLLLESKMDLQGNGWFDDDEEMQKVFAARYGDSTADGDADTEGVVEWEDEKTGFHCYLRMDRRDVWSGYVGMPANRVHWGDPSSWPEGLVSLTKTEALVKSADAVGKDEAREACMRRAASLVGWGQ